MNRHPAIPLRVRVVAPVAVALIIILCWTLVSRSGVVPRTLLPRPLDVVARLVDDFATGRVFAPTWVSITESVSGTLLAFTVAIPLAWLIVHVDLARAAFSPYLAASQAIPAVAIAPLLVVWVGYGHLPVILLCAVMVFFPMVLATMHGLRRIAPEVIAAARVDGAAGWSMARWIEWPLALPATLTGVRNGFTLSVTGAVVGELVMGGTGLGQRLAIQSQSNDTTGLFATIIVLCGLAITIYLTMAGVEWLTDPFAARPRWRSCCSR